MDRVGDILKNEEYVNGGLGDVKSIATTEFQDGGLPILDGECAMHRQASFYAANLPEGTEVAEDGDVFAFYLPTTNEDNGKPVLGGGEFVAAFADAPRGRRRSRPTSPATPGPTRRPRPPRPAAGSAPTRVSTSTTSPARSTSCRRRSCRTRSAVFRFDGSDQMPGAVGAGSFWKEMTVWITGQSTQDTLDNIESSWP